jgi:hypothetical protein
MYEAKMMWQFNHRYGSYEGRVADRGFVILPETPVEAYEEPDYSAKPYCWLPKSEVRTRLGKWNHDWLVGFRDITSAVVKRTAVFCILPFVGTDFTLRLAFPNVGSGLVTCFVANANCLVFDYICRQSVAGTHLADYITKQLPFLPIDRYAFKSFDFIVPRVVELTYTAWDLQPSAQDILSEVGQKTWARWFESDHLGSPSPVHCSPPPDWAAGPTPPPFVWDEERRARLRAELDAIYAHLYGLTREELEYILETFPIVKRKDEEKFGEYRTKRMILENYDALAGRFG